MTDLDLARGLPEGAMGLVAVELNRHNFMFNDLVGVAQDLAKKRLRLQLELLDVGGDEIRNETARYLNRRGPGLFNGSRLGGIKRCRQKNCHRGRTRISRRAKIRQHELEGRH